MEISEITENEQSFSSGTFTFEPIDIDWKKEDLKKITAYFMKWGLDKHFQQFKFRYNLKFSELNPENFLLDFFNDANVKSVLSFLDVPKEGVSKLEFSKLRCSLTNLNIFDVLEEKEIVVQDNIKKTYDDRVDDIEIQDLLRELILKEESENYTIFDEMTRQEFLFKLFSHLVLGGSMCQYEDKLSPYLDMTKLFYKMFVSVKKDSLTNSIFVESSAFAIKKIMNGYESFDHPQNFLYVVVNPSLKIVNVLSNKWVSYW